MSAFVPGSNKIIDTITKEEVVLMRLRRSKWTDIACQLKVLVSTMRNWREQCDYTDPLLVGITDGALDEVVTSYVSDNPSKGEA